MNQGSILITGCSSGIGKAAAFGLANKGFHVIAATRTHQQAKELTAAGLSAVVIDNDDSASIRNGWEHALKLAGVNGVSGLFANAGFGLAGALEDLTLSGLEAQFRTNVFGTHELVRLAVKHMRQSGGGRIVICSSVLGLVGMPMRGAYVASKFALEAMADVWRLELRDTSIKVSLLEPGPVMTQFRTNSHKAFTKYIDPTNSHYKDAYAKLESRLIKPGPAVPFTAQPEACIPMLVHAFTSKSPKTRYYWTIQTRVFSVLRRALPTRFLDSMLAKG